MTNLQHSNGVFETRVRVWQNELQRDPGGINWANNATTAFKFFDSASQSSLKGTGSGKIVLVEDEGVLGKNAIINGVVGANGTVELLSRDLLLTAGDILKVQAATANRLHVVGSITEIPS